MHVGAVITAAGMSKRMNDFKQLLKVGELSIAERVIRTFQAAGVQDIVMVTGYRAEELEKSLNRLGIVFLRNEAYETTEMFDSAKIGLSYLKDRVDRVFFCPVDVPFFSEDTLKLELSLKERIVFPICHNRLGHPILFDGKLIPRILEYEGPRGLKGALESLGIKKVCYLPVSDEGVVIDTDTKEGLEHLQNLRSNIPIKPNVKVTFAGNEVFFGPGTVTILREINSLGSVSEACKKTHISYSKGWKIIHAAEEELGYNIIECTVGGKNGGSSVVTEKGLKLMVLYELLEKRVREAAEKEFCSIFSDSDLFFPQPI